MKHTVTFRAKLDFLIKNTCLFFKLYIPNGCFDAYEVKVNKGIFYYQEINQFQWFKKNFNGLLEFASFP